MTPESPEPVERSTGVGPSARRAGRGRRIPAGRVPVSKARSAGFTVSLLVLAGAVPTLGWVGLTLIRNSRAGTLVTRVSDPRAPGYEAIVDPTPTALVVQKDSRGGLVGLTFLALGGSAGGGSAMFLPTATAVASPARPGDTFVSISRREGEDALVRAVGATLNVGLSDVIDVDDAKWAALTTNSGPIALDNPDALTAGTTRFAAGRLSLQPGQVGPYLAAVNRGESELNRLNRSQLFWQAWLRKIAASASPDAIPGETKSGIGLFVTTLSRGAVRLEPMPVRGEPSTGSGGATLFQPIGDQMRNAVATAVPYPTAPGPGARISVRLLNGVDGSAIPQSLVQGLVRSGASIAVVGNDHRFGRAKTLVQYRVASDRDKAEFLRYALGGQGTVKLNLQASDTVDVTIVLGRDVLPRRSGAPRDPTSPTSAASITTTTRSTATGG